MNFRASFNIVGVDRANRILYIVDNNDSSKSVTNDAEHVCYELHQTFPDYRVIYRDTEGRWDELVHDKGRFLRFAPVKPPRR